MRIQRLGHVVLKVRDQKRAEAFYEGILGLRIVGRLDEMNMTFFTLGDHHDFAIAAVGDGPTPDERSPGLLHVAFKIGESLEELVAAKDDLESRGLRVFPMDHGVSQSLYVADPDANTVELYVDTSDEWRAHPAVVAQVRPLQL